MLKKFDRVVVCNPRLSTHGKHGMVYGARMDMERITIRLDDGRIQGYAPSSLELEYKEELKEFKRVVGVKFNPESDKVYAYADYDHPDIREGDIAVVEVRGQNKEVLVVYVIRPEEYNGHRITSKIIDVIRS